MCPMSVEDSAWGDVCPSDDDTVWGHTSVWWKNWTRDQKFAGSNPDLYSDFSFLSILSFRLVVSVLRFPWDEKWSSCALDIPSSRARARTHTHTHTHKHTHTLTHVHTHTVEKKSVEIPPTLTCWLIDVIARLCASWLFLREIDLHHSSQGEKDPQKTIRGEKNPKRTIKVLLPLPPPPPPHTHTQKKMQQFNLQTHACNASKTFRDSPS